VGSKHLCGDCPCGGNVNDRPSPAYRWYYVLRDIYRNRLKPRATDREVLKVSKIAVIVAAVGTLLLAINPPEMLAWLIWMGIGVMLATFVVPLLGGLYWRRATKEGAIASMALGLVSAGVFEYWHQFVARLPVHFHVTLWLYPQ
jgi:sodium/proline symporter